MKKTFRKLLLYSLLITLPGMGFAAEEDIAEQEIVVMDFQNVPRLSLALAKETLEQVGYRSLEEPILDDYDFAEKEHAIELFKAVDKTLTAIKNGSRDFSEEFRKPMTAFLRGILLRPYEPFSFDSNNINYFANILKLINDGMKKADIDKLSMHLKNLFSNPSTIQALADNPIAEFAIKLISKLQNPKVLKITLNGMSQFSLSQISDAIGSQGFVQFDVEKFEALCDRFDSQEFEGKELVGRVFQTVSDLGFAITNMDTGFSTKVEPELCDLFEYMITSDSFLLRMFGNVFLGINSSSDDRGALSQLRDRLTELMRRNEISGGYDISLSFRNSLFAFSEQVQLLAAHEEGSRAQTPTGVSHNPSPGYAVPIASSRADVCYAPAIAMAQPCCAPMADSRQPLTGFKASLLERASNHIYPIEVTDARLSRRILQLSEMTGTQPECIRWIAKKVLKTVAQVSSHIPEVIDAHILDRSIALSEKTWIPYEYIQWIARKILKTAQGY